MRTAEDDERSARARAAAQARFAQGNAQAGGGGGGGGSTWGDPGKKKGKESMAARLARAAPSVAVEAGLNVPKPADKLSEEEKQARHDKMVAEKAAKAAEKARALEKLAEDQEERQRRRALQAAGWSQDAAAAAASSGFTADGAAASSSAAAASSSVAGPPGGGGDDDASGESELRIRFEDGTVLRRSYGASEPLSTVAALVASERGADAGPFALIVPAPRREYSTAAQLATTLRQAQLVPRGTLLVLGEEHRGVQAAVTERARGAAAAGGGAAHVAQVQQMLAGLNGLQGPQGYEELLALEESMGHVAAGLSAEELQRLSVRSLERQPSAEHPRCCICCCDYVEGDRVMKLACGHEYHLECISTWLRAKKICPMCKQPAAAAPAEGAADDE